MKNTDFYRGQRRPIPAGVRFDEADLIEIEDGARLGLTRDEVLQAYTMQWDDFSADEQKLFIEHYNYGRIQGVKNMAKALVNAANNSKTGTAASLAFLGRFSEEWKKEQENVERGTFQFTLKV